MKNILFAAAIILAVGLGVWYYGNRAEDTVPNQADMQADNTDNTNQTNEDADSPATPPPATDSGQGDNPPPQEEEKPAFAATITHTESGFSSASVSIKVGDTVKWVNQASENMWVASAPHPIHTDYPEFDQKKGVGMGGEYTFTFTKAGQWRYHNHLNPSHFGSVTVIP